MRLGRGNLIALENDAELHFFDDQGFDTGYFQATLPAGHHWPRGMYVPSIVREVDHIVYMPRLSQHMLAGTTLAQKSAMGFLRDDSRHDMHNDAAGHSAAAHPLRSQFAPTARRSTPRCAQASRLTAKACTRSARAHRLENTGLAARHNRP